MAVVPGCGGQQPAPPAERAVTHFVATPEPGPPARPAASASRPWLTARIVRRTALRTRPGGAVVARLGTRTEFGSPRVVGVVRRQGAWLQVVATERRRGRPAWIRAGAARLGATDISIHVDRSARRLVLRRGAPAVARMSVAVGRPGTETPLGRFAVTDKLRPQAPDSPYGCCILALSGHQPRLVPGWPGGDRLAIHATPQLESVGRAASLGCLRGRPRDVRRLMRAVPLGAPVFIRA